MVITLMVGLTGPSVSSKLDTDPLSEPLSRQKLTPGSISLADCAAEVAEVAEAVDEAA